MRADLFLSALFTASGIFLYLEALKLPKGLFGTLGPGYFPKLILLALIGASGLLTLRLLVQLIASRGKENAQGKGREGQADFYKRYRFVILTFVLFFFYLLGLKWIGFVFATLLFMPVLMWRLAPVGGRNWGTIRTICFTTLLLTFGLYGLFTYAFNVMLPAGTLFY